MAPPHPYRTIDPEPARSPGTEDAAAAARVLDRRDGDSLGKLLQGRGPMTLLGPFDRPVALKLFEAGVMRRTTTPGRVVGRGSQRPAQAKPSTSADERRVDIARFLTRALLGDPSDAVPQLGRLEAMVDESVVVRSPSMYTTSRSELVRAIFARDDAITTNGVEIVGEAIGGTRVYLEWLVTGWFDGAGFLNDDLLIEPSHCQVEVPGVLVCGFRGELVSHITCFYDRVALLEQLVLPPIDHPAPR